MLLDNFTYNHSGSSSRNPVIVTSHNTIYTLSDNKTGLHKKYINNIANKPDTNAFWVYY